MIYRDLWMKTKDPCVECLRLEKIWCHKSCWDKFDYEMSYKYGEQIERTMRRMQKVRKDPL